MAKNVHKQDIAFVKLPTPKRPKPDNGGCCDCPPELKLASFYSVDLIENDITGFSHKLQTPTDTCVFQIIKDDVVLTNNGVDYPTGFPYEPLVRAFVWNWKWYLVNHGQGCYQIKKNYTIAGIPLTEDLGHYNLLEFTPDNAKSTVRALNQFNFESLWEESNINYTDSGFEDSYRFRGMFGQWQPNVMSESNFSVLNENRVASIKSKDTYILNHFHATECHIERLHKLVMHSAIWRMTDHNPNNTLQESRIYECVLDKENKEQINYNAGSRVTGIDIILSKRQQNSVSLFGGSIQLPQGVTWLFPTVTGGGGACQPATVTVEYANGTPIATVTVTSGGSDVVVVPNCAPQVNEWELQYIGTTDLIAVNVTLANQHTFTSETQTNTGNVTYSTDGITFVAITFPFTPSVGLRYFKRPSATGDGTYILIA